MADRRLSYVVEEKREGRRVLKETGDDMKRLGDETAKTEDKTRLYTEDQKRLSAEIEKSTAKIRSLREQIARTGDTSLFGDLRKEESRVKSFERLAENLKKDAVKAGTILGKTVTNSFAKQLSGAFEGEGGATGPLITGAIIGLVAVLGPPLGAMISGAVVGAAGAGGLVGGVLAASHDQRVKTAFGNFAQTAEATFFSAGNSFVDPILRALPAVSKAFQNLNLDQAFGNIAPTLPIIVNGFTDLVKNIMPGLNKLFERAGPFAVAFAKGAAEIGTSLSEFFDNVSASKGAVEGLQVLLDSLGGTIKFLGVSLKFLSDVFHLWNTNMAFAVGSLDQLLQKLGIHKGFIHNAAEGYLGLIGKTTDATHATGAFSGAVISNADALAQQNAELKKTVDLVGQYLSAELSVDQANLGFQKDLMDFNQTLIDNGKAWNKNTQAGLDERTAFAGLLADIQRIRQANIDAGMSVQDANAQYDAQLQKLLKLAAQAGATKQQLDDLAGTYYITLIEDIQVRNQLNKAAAIDKAMARFASGGTTPANQPFVVGENGPEVLFGSKQHYVATKAQMGGMGGGGTANVVVSVAPGANAKLLEILRFEVLANGGLTATFN